MNLNAAICVLVGASQGFGKALAGKLTLEGATVIIVSKTPKRIEDASKELNAVGIVADVRKEADLQNVASTVISKYGRIDLWVNSAGVFKVFPKDQNLDMARARELLDVNFFGVVLGSKTAIQSMKDKGGIVMNILSSAALDASRAINAELYAASKWAVRGYVDALRSEYKNSPIKFYSVYPGGMRTHLHDEALPAEFNSFMDPEYVADKVILNLKSEVPEQDLIIKRSAAEGAK